MEYKKFNKKNVRVIELNIPPPFVALSLSTSETEVHDATIDGGTIQTMAWKYQYFWDISTTVTYTESVTNY